MDRGTPEASERVGMVLGTEDATPLTFWVGVEEGAYLQLDDAVVVDSEVPGRGPLRIAGIVQDVRARHEGASFDTDVFLVERGVLPVDTAVAARVVATRFEPEIFVPPMPGLPAFRARGKDREEALYFDRMERRLPAGLTRDGEPVFLDLDFLDGTRGAHVNISGVSGVATKTTYALFLLYSLFHTDVLGPYAANTKALVFNVKGEDLMWLDRPNARLSEQDRADLERLGLPAGPFSSVGLWAPVRARAGGQPIPDVEGRSEGVTAYHWTVREFVREKLLRF
ncbi:MAG TPA: ATP-binding protein, partial [Actinomycetota bacterium]|nr:ATP-binding protein [Actinomycetota bacterium]